MTLAATFLAGAKSRLLPMSVPFRFFAAATVFHILLWAAMLAGAGQLTSFRGGLGPILAAVHLLTLGVFAATAVGASVQLLPVATRRSLAAVWPIKLVFWLLLLALVPLLAGMHFGETRILAIGALATAAPLVLFAILLANNLQRATSLPVVAAYGWGALAALVALIALGVLLSLDYGGALLPAHGAAALAHLILGGFGFMGLLALGFSHVLIPMFALAGSPDKRRSFVAFGFALVALVIGAGAALMDSRAGLSVAVLLGLVATTLHLDLMRHALATGMRKRLGLSFVLIRAAWLMLPLTLVAGLAALFGLAGANGATLFGFLLLFGWLLTFLLGILQRIMPFLASMHATRSQAAAPPLLSELAASWPLKLHGACHGLAIAILAVAIVLDSVSLARLGSGVGLIGAIAFGWFTADVIGRVARARQS
jgi:hypothetical protein